MPSVAPVMVVCPGCLPSPCLVFAGKGSEQREEIMAFYNLSTAVQHTCYFGYSMCIKYPLNFLFFFAGVALWWKHRGYTLL